MDAHLIDRLLNATATGAAHWLPTLVDGAVKATLVLAVAASITALMRRWGAATRHLVWSAAVAAVLVLPAISLVAPTWRIPIGVARNAMPRLTITVPSAAPAVEAMPAERAPAIAPRERVLSSSAPITLPSAERLTGETTSTPHVTIAPLTWLAIVWALGAMIVLARLVAGTVGLARLVARSSSANDGAWLLLVQQLSRELGIRRPVTLLVGRTGVVPVTWGVVYPIVLLPADADEWSEERRRAVLLHELAHVERFDALTHVVAQLALAVFWFHPLVILAARRLRAERERACDDLVLSVGTRASTYANDLLDLVRTLGGTAPAAAALAMARRSEFEGRLLSILDPAVPRARTSRRAAMAACIVATVGVVPLAGARPVWQEPATPPVPATPARPATPPTAALVAMPRTPAMPAMPATPTTSAAPVAPVAPAVPAQPATPLTPLSALGSRISLGACQPRAGRHVSSSEDGARSRTMIADGNRCLEVQLDGRVEFTDDDGDVASLSSGGMLVIAETRRGATRQLSIRERGGRLERVYTIDGAPASERDGDAWLRTIIPTIARETTIGVQDRVARVRRQRGVAGVLEDIGTIASDGVKRSWVEALLAGGRVSDEDLRDAALVVGRTFTSDGDKASVLRSIAERSAGNPSIGMAVVTASQSVTSDGDRRSILARVTDVPNVSGAVLAYATHSARGINSDGDKAALLRGLAPRAVELPAVRSAIVDIAGTITSDGDRASVLEALLVRSPDDVTLVDVLRVAHGIASTGDRRRVLVAALARTELRMAAVRDAFFLATDDIASDGDHASVLRAALGRSDLPGPVALGVIRSTAKIASDHEKSNVLLDITSHAGALDDAATRTAFLAALATVSSGGEYRRVMERVSR